MGDFKISLTKYKDVGKQTRITPKQSSKTKRKSKKRGDGKVFALEGVHGVGKSTVYDLLKSFFEDFPNMEFFPERLRPNPPVPFGSKNKQTAFRAELHYNQQMIERNRLVHQFIDKQCENIAILDRSRLSTIIYSKALQLPKIDYELILDTYNSVTWTKEYVIYLDADPKVTMDRIIRRGSLDADRTTWNEKDYEYLVRVHEKYENVFREVKLKEGSDLTRINTEKKSPHEVANEIVDIISRKCGITNWVKPDRDTKNQKKITDWV